MKPTDNGYVYNPRVPEGAVSGELFTVRVSPFDDAEAGPGTSMYFVLRIE